MITFITLIFVVVVTALLFGVWLITSIFKFIWRLIAPSAKAGQPAGPGRPCMNPACRTSNPMQARFCRRCGSNLREAVFAQQLREGPPRYHAVSGRERQWAGV